MADRLEQIKDLENLKKLSKDDFDTKVLSLEQARISLNKALNSDNASETEVERQNVNNIEQDVTSLREEIQSIDNDIANLKRDELNTAGGLNPNYTNAAVVGDNTSNLDKSTLPKIDANKVKFGAQPQIAIPATVNIKSLGSKENVKDLRVKLRIPSNYIYSNQLNGDYFSTPELNSTKYDKIRENGGIIFPYTPNILFNHSVAYSKQNPIHSNYALNFYKNSEIGNITVQSKFTVQNNSDAEMYIASTSLLYLMTKMRFGDDPLAGLPPPICRLDAYGTYMLSNVPVSVATVTVEYPENVDYFIYEPLSNPEDKSAVPTISQVSVTLIPMYSRQEMLEATVDSFINNFENQKKKGYI